MKIDFEIDEKGKITLNLFDMLYELDEDAKRELLEQNGWVGFVTEAMATELIEGVSGINYNPMTHHLREKLLTSQAMPVILRAWVEAVITEAKYKTEETNRYRSDYYNLIGYIRKYYYGITQEEGFPRQTEWSTQRVDDATYKDILEHADAIVSLFPEEKPEEINENRI